MNEYHCPECGRLMQTQSPYLDKASSWPWYLCPCGNLETEDTLTITEPLLARIAELEENQHA